MGNTGASYPFRNVGLAVAFSPRLEQLLKEAWVVTNICNARLILIHAGKATAAKEQELIDLFVRCNLESARVKIVWEPGDVVDVNVKVCKEERVDLLIEGASKREGLFKHYIGSVSRQICRHARCSVLMLTAGPLSAVAGKRIVVNGSNHIKTINTINTTLYFGKKLGASFIDIIEEVADRPEKRLDELALKRIKHQLLDHDRIPNFIETLNSGDLQVSYQSVKGLSGRSIANYARENDANLIAINSPDTGLTVLDRIFPHDIEHLLADMPCHLLIVHQRK